MPRPDARRRELAQIHIAKKELLERGLLATDDDYRSLLWTLCRVRSSGDLDPAGRRRVLTHMRTLGWRPRRRGRPRPATDRQRLVAKIRALLINDPGGARPDRYADAMAQRMFGVERFEWLVPGQLHKVIQALEVDKRRRT